MIKICIVGLFGLYCLLRTSTIQAQIQVKYDSITGHLSIYDVEKGKNIYTQNPEKQLWTSEDKSQLCTTTSVRQSIAPDIQIALAANGADITYRFENSSQSVTSIGEFCLGKFNMDSTIHYRNTAYTFSEEELVAKANVMRLSQAHIYPSTTSYSPVTIFRDHEYIVGVSFIYPVLEYKHTINQLLVGTFYNGYPSGWELVVQANMPCNGQSSTHGSDIQPGETRVYTVALRIQKVRDANRDWKDVIWPYKEHFEATYGAVRYTQDRRPVLGYHGVSDHLQTQSNPYGYWNVSDDVGDAYHPLRPDHHGYEPTVTYILKMLEANACKRIMIWAPTGLYLNHKANNYPFQFTSRWFQPDTVSSTFPFLPPKMHPVDAYKKVPRKGKQLGLWWGHSVSVSRRWDSDKTELFDPNNSEHWELSRKELQGAKSTGATVIGLDSYSQLQGWDQITWMDSMQALTQHSFKFIAEQYTFDILHTRAAFFYAPWNVTSKHDLADYIVPGNEKWILILPDQIENITSYTRQVSKWGYTICLMTYLGAPKYKLRKATRSSAAN